MILANLVKLKREEHWNEDVILFANAVHCGRMAARFLDHVSVIKFALYSYFSLCPFYHSKAERKISSIYWHS